MLPEFLSSSAEVHALVHGIYAGASTRPWRFGPEQLPDNDDVRAEPHYFKGGAIVGTGLQWLVLAGVARGVIAVPPGL